MTRTIDTDNRGRTMSTTVAEFCRLHRACCDGRRWAIETGEPGMAELWARDDIKPAWRIWIATRPGVLTDRELRLFACWCCRNQVWHLLTDERSRHAVEVAELYAEGKATSDELAAAEDAAWGAERAAAWAAAWAAEDAAWAAAWAAEAAAWAAEAAAWAAARAAEDAAWAAARDAAEAAARDAARDAACASARDAAWYAALAAAEAAQSAYLKAHAHPRF
jgi:hypothetical protein